MNGEISKNYKGDGWFEEEFTNYEEDSKGFVKSGDNVDSVGGYGSIERMKISQDSYDFTQHPQVIREKINRALEAKFGAFKRQREQYLGGALPIEQFPLPRGRVKKGEILYEKGLNGASYLYMNLFGRNICLGTISSIASYGKGGVRTRSIMHRYALRSKIIGDIVGQGSDKKEAVLEMLIKAKEVLTAISPEDFPQEEVTEETSQQQEEGNYKPIVRRWSSDDIDYTLSSVKNSEKVCLEFTYNGIIYSTLDIETEKIRNKKVFFLDPKGYERRTANAFKKRIGGRGKSFERRLQKLMENIVKVLKGNKAGDRELIEYLNSLKK